MRKCPAMTDRHLLEAAAKAAGYDKTMEEVAICDATGQWTAYVKRTYWENGRECKDYWDPLNDDGDALRLAVKVLNWPHGGRAFDSQVTAMYAVGKLPSDPYVATRRAIVRAAAETLGVF